MKFMLDFKNNKKYLAYELYLEKWKICMFKEDQTKYKKLNFNLVYPQKGSLCTHVGVALIINIIDK